MAENRPNILILMTDQQRADCMGCAGNTRIQTPSMDRIAAEGVRFAQAVTSSPLCMPARASFLCGRHVHAHGMWVNDGQLDADDDSLFRSLQQCGYYTGHIGKSHYHTQQAGEDLRDMEPYMHARGFDYVHETPGPWGSVAFDSYLTDAWKPRGLDQRVRDDYARRREFGRDKAFWPSPLDTDDHLDSYIGRQAVRFLEGYDQAEPFALFVGFGGPHPAWDPPQEYADMYDPADMPGAIAPTEPGPWVPKQAAERQRSRHAEGVNPADIAKMRAAYYGKISQIDHWMGRIFSVCEARGWMDDLLVVFWSDHGEMAGDHGRYHKSCFYEASLRVPLLMRWPGRIEPGTVSDELAQTVDIMPTVLQAAGQDVPERCQGRPLWPVLNGSHARLRGAALSEVRTGGRRITMACTKQYKYAVLDDGQGYMLYDLSADPLEQDNLIGRSDMQPVEARMREQLCELVGDGDLARKL